MIGSKTGTIGFLVESGSDGSHASSVSGLLEQGIVYVETSGGILPLPKVERER